MRAGLTAAFSGIVAETGRFQLANVLPKPGALFLQSYRTGLGAAIRIFFPVPDSPSLPSWGRFRVIFICHFANACGKNRKSGYGFPDFRVETEIRSDRWETSLAGE